MKKIIGGLMGVFAVAAVVTGSAFALFTSQATVNGINLTTGNAVLLVDIGGLNNFQPTQTLPGGSFGVLIPGEDDWGEFSLKNNSSSSSVDPLNLNVTAKLTSAGGDWGTLNSVIQAVVYVKGSTVDNNYVGTQSTGWQTLAFWNSNDVDIPGDPIAPQGEVDYIVRYRLDPAAGNEAAGKNLTNVTFVFTGTQVNP